MVSGSDGTVSQRSASQRLRGCCRLFAEKHAMSTGAERGQVGCRDAMVRMLCVCRVPGGSSTQRAVSREVRAASSWGSLKATAARRRGRRLVAGGEEEESRVKSAMQRVMMQWLVEGGGGEEGGGGVKFARREGGWW